MRFDAKWMDELNVGDTLKISYQEGPDSALQLQKVEIKKIELRHPRSGDSYLDVELQEIE